MPLRPENQSRLKSSSIAESPLEAVSRAVVDVAVQISTSTTQNAPGQLWTYSSPNKKHFLY